MTNENTFPSIGDWVQVQIKWYKPKPGISVVSGTIVEADTKIANLQQFKLDNGTWFSPQSDTILRHEPAMDGLNAPNVDAPGQQ